MCHTQEVPVAIRTAHAQTPGSISELIIIYALGCRGGRAAEL